MAVNGKRRRQQIITGAGVGVGATLLMGGTAQAADFTVTTLDDSTDLGTLRSAIANAQLPGNSGSKITFQSGLSGTIHLGSALPEITEPTTIQGPGAEKIAISGDDAYAIFELDSTEDGFPVSISGLTLTDANTPGSGAAINTYNADLTLTGMVISDNVANDIGGAIEAYSGFGLLTIRDSTVTGNSTIAGVGGAIYAVGQPIAIENSTFAGNSSPYRGGAIGIDEPSGPSTIENSTFFKNRMTAYSGTSSGGALYVYGADHGVTISGSTIVENTATYGGGIFNHDAFDAPPIVLHDTIVSGNSAMLTGPNLGGPFESAFSLLENTTGASVTDAVPGSDILGQDPQLGDLASNGGPTQTIMPAATSPVVDRGSAFGLGTDQRGLARPFDAPTIANSGGRRQRHRRSRAAGLRSASGAARRSRSRQGEEEEMQEEEAQALGRERQEEEMQEEKEAPLSAPSRGGVHMLQRMLIASALAVAGLGLAAPVGASAATTLGETFPPAADLSCGGPNYEVVQTQRASGTSYAAPSPGVLTSWSFEASSIGPTTLTLRVFHPTGTPQQFVPIVEGGPQQTIGTSSGLHTFTTQIPVETGDLIGIHSTNGPCATNTLASGDVYDAHLGTPNPFGTPAIYSEGSGLIFDISAKLEPDCDKDGLGDETQDSDVTAACPTPPSPPGTTGPNGSNGQPTTKAKCKKHKKKHKRSAESAKKHKKKKCKKKKKKKH